MNKKLQQKELQYLEEIAFLEKQMEEDIQNGYTANILGYKYDIQQLRQCIAVQSEKEIQETKTEPTPYKISKVRFVQAEASSNIQAEKNNYSFVLDESTYLKLDDSCFMFTEVVNHNDAVNAVLSTANIAKEIEVDYKLADYQNAVEEAKVNYRKSNSELDWIIFDYAQKKFVYAQQQQAEHLECDPIIFQSSKEQAVKKIFEESWCLTHCDGYSVYTIETKGKAIVVLGSTYYECFNVSYFYSEPYLVDYVLSVVNQKVPLALA